MAHLNLSVSRQIWMNNLAHFIFIFNTAAVRCSTSLSLACNQYCASTLIDCSCPGWPRGGIRLCERLYQQEKIQGSTFNTQLVDACLPLVQVSQDWTVSTSHNISPSYKMFVTSHMHQKVMDFWMSQTVTHSEKVIISQKLCSIVISLLQTSNTEGI